MKSREISREIREKSSELSLLEKKRLFRAWTEIALAHPQSEDIASLDNEGIKKWLAGSIMSEIDALCEDWSLINDGQRDAIDNINAANNKTEKAEAQLDYLKKIFKDVGAFVRSFIERKQNRSRKYDSWPKTMASNKSFNCAGSTLIGIHLLDRAGIVNYQANPAGHCANVARLADGRFYWVDLLNHGLIQIDPLIDKLEGNVALRINDTRLAYKIIPLIEKDDLAESVLGNLSCAQRDLIRPQLGQELRTAEANEIFTKHPDIARFDLDRIQGKLYPEIERMKNSKEMKEEHKRVDALHDGNDEMGIIRGFFRGISETDLTIMAKKMADNIDLITDFLSGKDVELNSILPVNYSNLLCDIKQVIERLNGKNPSDAESLRKKILSEISKISKYA